MLILAADTSGKQGSIALAHCFDNGKCDVIEVVPLVGGTFSAQLVPQVAALLSKHGFKKQDIDERLVKPEALTLPEDDSTLVTSHEGIVETLVARGIPVREVPVQRSDAIACLGWKKILAQETVSPEALEANYIRRSDAEIFSKS